MGGVGLQRGRRKCIRQGTTYPLSWLTLSSHMGLEGIWLLSLKDKASRFTLFVRGIY